MMKKTKRKKQQSYEEKGKKKYWEIGRKKERKETIAFGRRREDKNESEENLEIQSEKPFAGIIMNLVFISLALIQYRRQRRTLKIIRNPNLRRLELLDPICGLFKACNCRKNILWIKNLILAWHTRRPTF